MAIACACGPCVYANDPRDTANAAVQDWINATGETDLCRIDAMQHCVGAALLSGDCGATCAVCAGEINEFLQGDGDPMDYANNEAGAGCATQDPVAAVTCCEDKLHSGQLVLVGNCE
jgi:hypothetical protein